MEELLASGGQPSHYPGEVTFFSSPDELMAPLRACYESLHACGAGAIAEGRLADLIRRVACFGLALLKLDIRQEAARHTEALDAVTQYLGLGSFSAWDEAKRCAWLGVELSSRRPLVPQSMPVSPPVREVLDSFRTAAELGTQSLGAYVISMASSASDVLAVELLQREARLHANAEPAVSAEAAQRGGAGGGGGVDGGPLRVVPLFETLKDLEGAPAVLTALFAIPWYRQHLKDVHGDHQEVMLGYSDSGKDAGRLAAAWALYTCQERVVEVCKEYGVRLTLFHGRGGSIGRGGGPMHLAIQSQPPGSIHGSLRVTEQGEMVQAKFGMGVIATRQMEIFTTAVLLATLTPPPPPINRAWSGVMDRLGVTSCAAYRAHVVGNELFMRYFEEATPQSELGNLNIGSRPARRKQGVPDIASMRAIPWIFAWTQSRSVLPAWLGVGAALTQAINEGGLEVLRDMYDNWPFFKSTIDLIEMILSKADMRIQRVYEDKLCSAPETRAVGEDLRVAFAETVSAVLCITRHGILSESNPTLRRLIDARAPHINILNLVQAEVLRRLREDGSNAPLRDALLVSINGIAAGMRNTG
jgi:phosphoenolpyruvate carboxylase